MTVLSSLPFIYIFPSFNESSRDRTAISSVLYYSRPWILLTVSSQSESEYILNGCVVRKPRFCVHWVDLYLLESLLLRHWSMLHREVNISEKSLSEAINGCCKHINHRWGTVGAKLWFHHFQLLDSIQMIGDAYYSSTLFHICIVTFAFISAFALWYIHISVIYFVEKQNVFTYLVVLKRNINHHIGM